MAKRDLRLNGDAESNQTKKAKHTTSTQRPSTTTASSTDATPSTWIVGILQEAGLSRLYTVDATEPSSWPSAVLNGQHQELDQRVSTSSAHAAGSEWTTAWSQTDPAVWTGIYADEATYTEPGDEESSATPATSDTPIREEKKVVIHVENFSDVDDNSFYESLADPKVGDKVLAEFPGLLHLHLGEIQSVDQEGTSTRPHEVLSLHPNTNVPTSPAVKAFCSLKALKKPLSLGISTPPTRMEVGSVVFAEAGEDYLPAIILQVQTSAETSRTLAKIRFFEYVTPRIKWSKNLLPMSQMGPMMLDWEKNPVYPTQDDKEDNEFANQCSYTRLEEFFDVAHTLGMLPASSSVSRSSTKRDISYDDKLGGAGVLEMVGADSNQLMFWLQRVTKNDESVEIIKEVVPLRCSDELEIITVRGKTFWLRFTVNNVQHEFALPKTRFSTFCYSMRFVRDKWYEDED